MQERLDYGSRIKAVRKHSGLNRSAFAAKIGTSGTTIKNIEEGDTKNPGSTLLAKIASEFKVDLNWLNSGHGDMFNTSSNSISGNSLKSEGNRVNISSLGHNEPRSLELQAELNQLKIENKHLLETISRLERDKENLLSLLMKK